MTHDSLELAQVLTFHSPTHMSRLRLPIGLMHSLCVNSGLACLASQVSSGQSKSSSTSSSEESTAAETASQITESDMSSLETGASASGRHLLKEGSRTEKQRSAAGKVELDPARVAGRHSCIA